VSDEKTRPVIVSSDTSRDVRVPPGQSLTNKWPVLHYGDVPNVELSTWDFRVFGKVKGKQFPEWKISWEVFRALRWIDVKCDIQCVTRWSRLNNVFSGPSTRTVLEASGVTSDAASFVLVHGEGGFTTNLSMGEFLAEDCLFAIEHDGQALSKEHGWPVRLVVPRLYFWKSAKWVRGVELMEKDEPGFWESNGYHTHGDPWLEERHSW
jgi:DMSO/TMAO reductase YedYZ molybdopterin-dependent catalytic subunit